VLQCFDDPAPEVQRAALDAAAALKLREAIPRLMAAAQDDRTRADALRALAALPDERAVPLFIAALDDRSPETRRTAESALAALGDRARGALEAALRAGRSHGLAALAAERILARFDPVVSWRVIGPFARAADRGFLAASSIDFGKTRAGADGRPIVWTPRTGEPDTGRVVLDDLKGIAGDASGDATNAPDLGAFGYAEIASDADRVALLRIGSSGALTVAVNAQVVYDDAGVAGRPYAPDTDVVRLALRAGTNRLVVQTRPGIGAWAFSLQVSRPSAVAARPAASPGALRDFALRHTGDPKRGEALFFDPNGVGCARCHCAGGRGTAHLGPDLTGLALKYDRAEIVRSVLEPSQRIATGYQPVLLATTDGKVHSGLVRAETDTDVELVDAQARLTRVPKRAIAARRLGDVSVMPREPAARLSLVEFADLVSYLETLKDAPRPAR
jgi:putative heme-binding domain-containing protein